MKRRKNNKNTLINIQQTKFDYVNNNNNNTTLITGFSNCGKTYLLNYFLLQKQEPISIIKKSLEENLIVKAQTSDEIQPLENYEKNSTTVFDDMLLSKQESRIDLFLLQVDTKILI